MLVKVKQVFYTAGYHYPFYTHCGAGKWVASGSESYAIREARILKEHSSIGKMDSIMSVRSVCAKDEKIDTE